MTIENVIDSMVRHKVFISYKFNDKNVGAAKYVKNPESTNDFHKVLIKKINTTGTFEYGGENPHNSRAGEPTEITKRELAKEIFHTSVTIILMSTNMKKQCVPEHEQWIPWEVSYSLQNHNNSMGRSRPNAMIAVILPDRNGSYRHFIQESPEKITIVTNRMFDIIRENMFNHNGERPDGNGIWQGDTHSYIQVVKWDDFIDNIGTFIQKSTDIRNSREEYRIVNKIDMDV